MTETAHLRYTLSPDGIKAVVKRGKRIMEIMQDDSEA